MTAQTPPTDRPLTAGGMKMNDLVLHKAPLRATASMIEVIDAVSDGKGHIRCGAGEVWRLMFDQWLADRASSPTASERAASEGAGRPDDYEGPDAGMHDTEIDNRDEDDPELPDTPEARTIFKHFCDVHGLHPDEAADSTGSLLADLAALASPPVSERERELEGADEYLAEELVRDQHGPSCWRDLTDEGRAYYVRRFSEAIKRANYARSNALTVQPKEPV